MFDYGENEFGSRVPQDLGFAGFRVHYPIKTPNYYDEVIVFLGASYFRAVGRDQVFGLSARGLAIDTAAPSGEEFPWFREFWLVRPAPNAQELTIYALLDSPSADGRLPLRGAPRAPQTRVDVEVRLFPRNEIAKLGIAPLTSMFFHGENGDGPIDDFRPEVHDSDGLLIASAAASGCGVRSRTRARSNVSSFATGARAASACSSATATSTTTRTSRRARSCGRASGSSRRATGARAASSWSRSRPNDTNDNIVAYWVPERRSRRRRRAALHTRCTGTARTALGRPAAGRRRDPARLAARSRARGASWSTSRARRSPSCPPRRVLRGRGDGDVDGRQRRAGAELLDQQVVKNPINGGWRLCSR